MQYRSIACTCAFALTLLTGCQTDHIRGPRSAYPDSVPLEGYPNVLLRDGLDRSLRLLGEPDVEAPAPTKAMSVRVRLRSVDERTFAVRYRFRFYGPNREVLTPNPVWHSVDFPPTLDRTLEARAIELSAAAWELEVAEFR